MDRTELLGSNTLTINPATIREALEVGLAATIGDSKITKVKEVEDGVFQISLIQEEKGGTLK